MVKNGAILLSCLLVGLGIGIWLVPAKADYQELVRTYALQAGVDPVLVAGVIQAESGGRPGVVSCKGALGLMQLMPRTATALAAELGLAPPDRQTLLSPEMNIRLGTYYLAKLSRLFQGNPYFVLAAYNAGPTRVRAWAQAHRDLAAQEIITRFAYEETRQYVTKIMTFCQKRTAQK